MSDDNKGDRKEFSAIVSSGPKELKSSDEMQRPNAYLNNWTDIATKGVKTEKTTK